MSAATTRLQRKLHAWELQHLRDVCADQARRIEELEQLLWSAECAADQWQREAEALREDVATAGGTVCLHMDGSTRVAYFVEATQ